MSAPSKMTFRFCYKENTQNFQELKTCVNMMFRYKVSKLFVGKEKNEIQKAHHKWIYLEINIPDINSFCLIGSHIYLNPKRQLIINIYI